MVFRGERQGQFTVKDYFPRGYPGRLQGLLNNAKIYPYINGRGEISTYDIDPPATPDDETVYYLSIQGQTISVNTGVGGMTATQLMDAFVAAINSDAGFYRMINFIRTGNTLSFSSRLVGESLAIAHNTLALSPLVISETQAASNAGVLPYGRFVAQVTGIDDFAYQTSQVTGTVNLPDLATDPIIGVVCAAFREKQQTENHRIALEGYRYGEVVDVCTKTISLDGIWVECVEPDLTPADSLYISVAAGHEGKVTRTSASNIDFTSRGRIVSTSETNQTNKNYVLVELY